MLQKIAQTPKTAKLPPRRQKNADLRVREYLTDKEIEHLRKAACSNQYHGLRNDTIILMMFSHALRVSELTALRWEQADCGIVQAKNTDTRTIQAYMEHANTKNTMIYTELNANRFNKLWDD